MAYIVNIDFTDTKTKKSYKKGERFDGEVYDALLNSNNQYREAFIIESEDITEVEATGTEDDEKVEDIEKLKVTELKKLLDKEGIEYPANAKKDELIKLAGE